jgi:cell division protease FtsH
MVREWGMSDVVGPMAWGSHNQVFLGDEMLAGRDYSDVTARVIDEEVQRILCAQEARCRDLLDVNRAALDLVARALLEHETISGNEVDRLIGAAVGRTDPAQGNGSSGETALTVEPEPAEDPTSVD